MTDTTSTETETLAGLLNSRQINVAEACEDGTLEWEQDGFGFANLVCTATEAAEWSDRTDRWVPCPVPLWRRTRSRSTAGNTDGTEIVKADPVELMVEGLIRQFRGERP